jgi:hypothetical protein
MPEQTADSFLGEQHAFQQKQTGELNGKVV